MKICQHAKNQPLLTPFGPNWPRLALFGPVWPCLALFVPVYPCFAVFCPDNLFKETETEEHKNLAQLDSLYLRKGINGKEAKNPR